MSTVFFRLFSYGAFGLPHDTARLLGRARKGRDHDGSVHGEEHGGGGQRRQIEGIGRRIGIQADLSAVGADRAEPAVFFDQRAVSSPKKSRLYDELLVRGIISLGRDEDELLAYGYGTRRDCPYYQYKDEYINVRKQI